jgi:hypothetical protein
VSSIAAIQKLVNVLGAERARKLSGEILRQIGVTDLRSPNDRLRFGDALIARGGVLESIGRSIKIQAILHGAIESMPAPSRDRSTPPPAPPQ